MARSCCEKHRAALRDMNAWEEKQALEKCREKYFLKNSKYFITARNYKPFLRCFGIVGDFSITSRFQGSWYCYHHVRWVVLPLRYQCLAHTRLSVDGNSGYEWNYELHSERRSEGVSGT